MTTSFDPERREIRALRRAVDFRGKRVLEIGCGDGRLTRRYARTTSSVYAVDVDRDDIRTARRALPPSLRGKVEFHCTDAEQLRAPRARFDIVLLSWSL